MKTIEKIAFAAVAIFLSIFVVLALCILLHLTGRQLQEWYGERWYEATWLIALFTVTIGLLSLPMLVTMDEG